MTKNLVKGSWLDLLCGYNCQLQQKSLGNEKINKFVSVDFKINKKIKKTSIEPIETQIEKSLNFPNESFDNITIINGLEHLWHDQEIITEIYRVLKKNGLIQVIAPTWFAKPILEFLAFRLNDKQASEEINDHKRYYSEKSLWEILIKAGFKPRDIKIKRIKFFCSVYALAQKS